MIVLTVAAFDQIAGIALPWQNALFFGHTAVLAFLKKMCGDKRLHHALLFKGQRGVGKATLAFHLAWSIFVHKGEKFSHPSAFCSIWQKIASRGGYPALFYVSHSYDLKAQKFRTVITIEEVLRINHYLQQTAENNGWRIIIIDSVEDMNRNAANALLKILEEPPQKTIFILVSHYPGKVLPTIRSRCLSVSFGGLERKEMRKILSLIGKPAGFDCVNSPQVDTLIKESHGSIRQALLMLFLEKINIAGKLDKIITASTFPIVEVYQLISTISRHDNVLDFDFFFSTLINNIAKKACDIAFERNLSKAYQLSCLWQQLQKEREEVKIYNIDKKQFALVLLQKVHSSLQ